MLDGQALCDERAEFHRKEVSNSAMIQFAHDVLRQFVGFKYEYASGEAKVGFPDFLVALLGCGCCIKMWSRAQPSLRSA